MKVFKALFPHARLCILLFLCWQIWSYFGWYVMIVSALDSCIVVLYLDDLTAVTSVHAKLQSRGEFSIYLLGWTNCKWSQSCSLAAQTCSWQDVANIYNMGYTMVIIYENSHSVLEEIVKDTVLLTVSPICTALTVCTFIQWWNKCSHMSLQSN